MSKQETCRDGFGVEIPAPLDEAVDRTAAALKQEGFGVLSMVDVRATL